MSGLREYQELAADFIFERDRSMVLAPVGAGKTAIALTAMQDYVDAGIVPRWLVVAPKRVCENVWPSEAAKWGQLTVSLALGSPAARRQAIQSAAQVVVINYDNLQWLAGEFPDLANRFQGVVFDELTRLKNPSGKRFKAFDTLIKPFKVRIGLTGSFTSNGLEDVFGQCKIIDQSVLGRSKGAFLQQYFWSANPQYNEWVPRPLALERIMARIKPITYLLENREYRDQLPPLHTVVLTASMPMDEYKELKHDLSLQFGDTIVTAASAGVVTGKLQQLAGGFLYETIKTPASTPGKFKTRQIPHWFSKHKFELLDDLLAENHRVPTLVWYWYQEEKAELMRRYPHAQTLDAPNAVNRWNQGDIELLVANPQSAGHGINLQGQSHMVFLSVPWSQELFEQAVGRLHRGGQKHEVWCYVLLTEGTVDEDIWDALRNKRSLSEIAVAALKNS